MELEYLLESFITSCVRRSAYLFSTQKLLGEYKSTSLYTPTDHQETASNCKKRRPSYELRL